MTTPTQVPAELIAGDTWEWTRNLSDYPAATWSAVWYFKKADHSFSVTGVASGDTHTATVTAATSAGYTSGKYTWQLVLTSGSVRKTEESGVIEVVQNPAAVGNADHRSTAQVMLDNIEAYLRDPTNLAAASYALGNRSLSRWSRADLIVERSRLKAELLRESQRELLASGVGVPRLQVRC